MGIPHSTSSLQPLLEWVSGIFMTSSLWNPNLTTHPRVLSHHAGTSGHHCLYRKECQFIIWKVTGGIPWWYQLFYFWYGLSCPHNCQDLLLIQCYCTVPGLRFIESNNAQKCPASEWNWILWDTEILMSVRTENVILWWMQQRKNFPERLRISCFHFWPSVAMCSTRV